MRNCIVCGHTLADRAPVCPVCCFRVRRGLCLSHQHYEIWRKSVVVPYRESWQLRQKIPALEKENTRLHGEIEQYKKENLALKRELEALQRQLQTEKEENQRLRQEARQHASDEEEKVSEHRVDCSEKDDFEALLEWAEKGDANAQMRVGDWYYKQNQTRQAAIWYRRSAEQGNAQAQDRYGACLYYGIGIAQNQQEGVAWYRKSAEQGHAAGQCY